MLGDSSRVARALLEREGMAGQVSAVSGRLFKLAQLKFKRPEQLERLRAAGRLHRLASRRGRGATYLKRYEEDFPLLPLQDAWEDTTKSKFAAKRRYPVETSEKVVTRCLLATTDPGDLVFDPTCGSGTTPAVAERWGRRWIACDASPLALAVTRRRLLAGAHPWLKLGNASGGPAGGFEYERATHLTLGD
ncbi:MAG: hypothetical protein Kow0069_24470 [Promethearchaeota archaeon]